ncbi:MAG TPA: endonuclease [Candidatus Kerfeldbacteria bacterium]|nr:endonuclease [Candidatus Kerfeldbacteria bacterium]
MYTVYIIQSQKTLHYYIGVTREINQRMRHHNSGANRSTKGKGPWRLVYREVCQDKQSAWRSF